jgi:hypothetical protein
MTAAGAPLDFDPDATLAIFRACCRRGFSYAAAGLWLDVFSVRLGEVHSPEWNAANPELLIQHEQQGAELSDLLREMTRILRRLSAHNIANWRRGILDPAGAHSLSEICCQAGALVANLRTTGHACYGEALRVLKDAFDDEDEELLGPWLKRDCQPQ